MENEIDIVFEIAEKACRSISLSVIRQMQKMQPSCTSDLKNAWNEVCVQVQGSESIHWDTYLESVKLLILRQIRKQDEHIIQAIWLDMGNNENSGVIEDEIVELILQDVLSEASNWKNNAIRSHLE